VESRVKATGVGAGVGDGVGLGVGLTVGLGLALALALGEAEALAGATDATLAGATVGVAGAGVAEPEHALKSRPRATRPVSGRRTDIERLPFGSMAVLGSLVRPRRTS
jgi:hypothetical protein